MRACNISGCSRAFKARGMCNTHYQQWRREYDGPRLSGRSYEERYWAKVDKNGPVSDYRPDLGPCWIWLGGDTGNGYGRFGTPSRLSHRIAYELLVGPIPDELELDHLCRVTLCGNPSHLEPVTHRVNARRGYSPMGLNAARSHCRRGHLFDEANTRIYRNKRICRACLRDKKRKSRATPKGGCVTPAREKG